MNAIGNIKTLQSGVIGLEQRKILRNTYILLSMTLLFSVATAGLSMTLNLGHPGIVITLLGYFGLLFGIHYFKNSAWGVALVFALTGFMGLTIGPILNMYMATVNGTQIVMLSMGLTATTFLSLTAYALISQRDFSSWGTTLMVGILVAFIGGLAGVFLNVPVLSLSVSVIFMLLMSGLILYETSNIIHGGERNYVMATVTLFVSIYNMFMSLIHLLGFLNNE